MAYDLTPISRKHNGNSIRQMTILENQVDALKEKLQEIYSAVHMQELCYRMVLRNEIENDRLRDTADWVFGVGIRMVGGPDYEEYKPKQSDKPKEDT